MGVNIRQIEKTSGSGYRLTTKNDGSWYAVPPTDGVINAYVDPVNGDNSKGVVGDAKLPFKDPWAARDAIENLPSTTRYTIYWLPGEYTVGDDSGNLKQIASTAAGNLHSNTHEITHHLLTGATLEIVTTVISTSLFILSTGGNHIIRIKGNGRINHTREAGKALLGSFLDDTGLGSTDSTYIELELDSLYLDGASAGDFITARRGVYADIKIKDINSNEPQGMLFISPNVTTSYINTYAKVSVDSLKGHTGQLIKTVGNTAGTLGIVNSFLYINIKGVDINAEDALVSLYRTTLNNTVGNITISGDIQRVNSSSSAVSIKESPGVDSVININCNGVITDVDSLVVIDTTATTASPHPINNNVITVNLNGVVAIESPSQGSAPFINYTYSSSEPGTKVIIKADAVLEDRLFFRLLDSQDVTISGNISTGTTAPIVVGEILTDDPNFKKLLKDLFIDAPTGINDGGYTGSIIYTANYYDRTSVNTETL